MTFISPSYEILVSKDRLPAEFCLQNGPCYIVLARNEVCGARQFSGRTPDSQSREPGFESSFATVSKFGRFRSLHDVLLDSAV